MKKIVLICSFIIITYNCFSQESVHHLEADKKGKHQFGLMLGHVHIPSAVTNGEKEWRLYPSTSFYYNYWISNTWSFGLHTDIIVEDFTVEKNLSTRNEEEIALERERPLAPAIMAVYKPGKHFLYALGLGGEFAKGEDLFLVRAEISYAVEISNEWEFEIALGNDFRFNAYNTINLGIGVSKGF